MLLLTFLFYVRHYVTLLHDEMTIKADLVFDTSSGDMVGYVNNSDGTNCAELANHVLVFYVVGINSTLSMSMGYFPTKSATAADLFPLLWEAVGLLETVCGLKVITVLVSKITYVV